MSGAHRKSIKKSNNCSQVFLKLMHCVKNTPCVKLEGKPLKECASSADLPSECLELRTRYTNCKRGQVCILKWQKAPFTLPVLLPHVISSRYPLFVFGFMFVKAAFIPLSLSSLLLTRFCFHSLISLALFIISSFSFLTFFFFFLSCPPFPSPLPRFRFLLPSLSLQLDMRNRMRGNKHV